MFREENQSTTSNWNQSKCYAKYGRPGRPKNTADQAGQNTADQAGRNTADQAGRNTADTAGRNTADQAGRNTADQAGRNTADQADRNMATRQAKIWPTRQAEIRPTRQAEIRPTMQVTTQQIRATTKQRHQTVDEITARRYPSIDGTRHKESKKKWEIPGLLDVGWEADVARTKFDNYLDCCRYRVSVSEVVKVEGQLSKH